MLTNNNIRPFLKWAGGKFRLLPRIHAVLPQGDRLVEPFTGGAAVWLNTHYPKALIADANTDLINLYRSVQKSGVSFIRAAAKLFTEANNTAESYYALRTEFNTCTDIWRRSLLFLYLNRHGFNGLCRYNAAGGFNVPFGRYSSPYFPENELNFFVRKSQTEDVTFSAADFRDIFAQIGPGDVVYCDPPYMPLTSTANFTSYTPGGFTLQDQQDLAGLAIQSAQSGITVVISNQATPQMLGLYTLAECTIFNVQRCISGNGDKRGVVPEVLASFSRGTGIFGVSCG